MENNFAEVFKNLMNGYDDQRKKWITFFGTDKGFDEYFTKQLLNK